MPKLGGRQVAEQLSKDRKGLLVLFMTGYTDDVVLRQELIEGGIEVLQNPSDLARRVRKILDITK
jgi:two-component system cell cycle sensor histidine kinase/response regulator CckA